MLKQQHQVLAYLAEFNKIEQPSTIATLSIITIAMIIINAENPVS